ncbi:MAG: hypothetical protein ABI668_12660 [Sphingorhabdus sp.]
MPYNVAVIDAHPDPDPARYVHALATTYADGAQEAGHDVRAVRLADHTIFPLVSRDSRVNDLVPAGVTPGQDAIS